MRVRRQPRQGRSQRIAHEVDSAEVVGALRGQVRQFALRVGGPVAHRVAIVDEVGERALAVRHLVAGQAGCAERDPAGHPGAERLCLGLRLGAAQAEAGHVDPGVVVGRGHLLGELHGGAQSRGGDAVIDLDFGQEGGVLVGGGGAEWRGEIGVLVGDDDVALAVGELRPCEAIVVHVMGLHFHPGRRVAVVVAGGSVFALVWDGCPPVSTLAPPQPASAATTSRQPQPAIAFRPDLIQVRLAGASA